MKESKFQKRVIDEIEERIPGCIVLKNDPTYKQGIPDLLILYEDQWASLEVKKSEYSMKRPNQGYYVRLMNRMSYSSSLFSGNINEE